MIKNESNGRAFWTTAGIIIALDVVTKAWAVRSLQPEHVPHPIIGEVVRFTLAYNPGAAFSMSVGPYSRYIFGAFAIVALVILFRLYRASVPGDRPRVFALGLAWGGAAGNLIDRFHSEKGVVDFIDIGWGGVRFWTFNVADSAVTVGALLLAWVLWKEDRQALAIAAAEAAARDEKPAASTRANSN
jgi:signal peptidase II